MATSGVSVGLEPFAPTRSQRRPQHERQNRARQNAKSNSRKFHPEHNPLERGSIVRPRVRLWGLLNAEKLRQLSVPVLTDVED